MSKDNYKECIDNIKFKKLYQGKSSFLKFLKDVKNGHLRLSRKNLVSKKSIMINNKLSWIDVYYSLSNIKELLKIDQQKKITVPKTITKCNKVL